MTSEMEEDADSRVGLTGNTGMVEFNRAMLSFFAHPGVSRGNAAHFAHRALDNVLACETSVLIVDDLHFLRWRNSSGVEISNHFKYIANEFSGHPDLRRRRVGGAGTVLRGIDL